MMAAGAKAEDFKGSLKKLLKYIGRYKISIGVVLIFAVASTIFSIFGPKVLGKATTQLFQDVMGMITGTVDSVNFTYIGEIILFLLGLYIVSALFSYLQGYIMSGVSMKVTYELRTNLMERCCPTLPMMWTPSVKASIRASPR